MENKTQKRKVLIVGGVAGGASAAARLRRLDEHAEIIMLEKGPYISFANCGLPYYIGGAIADRERLLVQTPSGMADRFGIDVRTDSEVISVDPERKIVQINSIERGEYSESYDELILSPGAKPVIPAIPGVDHPLIHTVRNIPDIDRIKKQINSSNKQSSIVIGGGFIGVEMAENLREAGLDVTLIEGNPQLLTPFDPEIAASLAQEMQQHGVQLLFSQRVIAFREAAQGIIVQLGSGQELQTDLVILAVGVVPDTGFLADSGIELGTRGHIIVNNKLETSVPHIHAAGDAIEVQDYIHQLPVSIPLAGPANKQGRIIADRLGGLDSTYKGTQGTSIIKVFGLTGATTGSNEKTLQRLGVPYQTTIVHPSSHASYYPGATALTIKLLFTPEGRILGAQAVGYEGVDKRIDDIAVVIRLSGTIHDLTELELSYAPPYSSAKDPVNMAGYAAQNIINGHVQTFTYGDIASIDTGQSLLVDVRTSIEHQNGHIPGSISVPVDELRARIGELDISREIWVYCQVGLRGYTAARILAQHGYRVKNLSGGYKTYKLMYPAATLSPPAQSSQDHLSVPVDHHSSKPKTAVVQPSASTAELSVNPYQSVGEPVAATAAALHSTGDANTPSAPIELDVCGLSCPGPLIQVKQQMDTLQNGQSLRVTASDPGFYEDIQAWASMSHQPLLEISRGHGGTITALLRKSEQPVFTDQDHHPAPRNTLSAETSSPAASTMVVFSGDLDKAIASFIIATGAAASGRKVTMFFTFWGLSVLRKPPAAPVSKNLISRMFGTMMPGSSRQLRLSRMNMLGMGPRMIRGIMQHKNVPSLEELIQTATSLDVEMVACQMSMDVMGIQHEELIDNVKIGGVGYYLGQADQASHNLFI
ncbi:FAD-dependent oxidoreductase [Paenibacillus bovis]|uniref:CoA-disulfide reductase n=1 Tax=Paenibacillus bovis TaxID=1616788 RepID=A0A172ZHY1_9BACL|nr:FAD-dependent oxidoreductase [Paenibacillus bovis]ANF97139.1 CoA-disulfide reductase [Paenibacillus bovis]